MTYVKKLPKWTPERELELVRRYRDEGRSASKLAHEHGCSVTTAYRIIKQHGASKGTAHGQVQRRKITKEDEARVAQEYRDGAKPKLLLERYGVTYRTLYMLLDRHGVPRQNPELVRTGRIAGFVTKAKREARELRAEEGYSERRTQVGYRGGLPTVAERNPFADDLKASYAISAKDWVERRVPPAEQATTFKLTTKQVFEDFRGPARSLARVVEVKGLPAVEVVKRIIPTVPAVTKAQASTRNGQAKAPLRVRFPPLPGEPGYEYAA